MVQLRNAFRNLFTMTMVLSQALETDSLYLEYKAVPLGFLT
jgi:hypothetical protein